MCIRDSLIIIITTSKSCNSACARIVTRTRKMTRLVPLQALRFTQLAISPFFKNGQALDELVQEIVADPDYIRGTLRPIRVVRIRNGFKCLDNRRLACLVVASCFLNRHLRVPVYVQKLRSLSRFQKCKFMAARWQACRHVRIRRCADILGKRSRVVRMK